MEITKFIDLRYLELYGIINYVVTMLVLTKYYNLIAVGGLEQYSPILYIAFVIVIGLLNGSYQFNLQVVYFYITSFRSLYVKVNNL